MFGMPSSPASLSPLLGRMERRAASSAHYLKFCESRFCGDVSTNPYAVPGEYGSSSEKGPRKHFAIFSFFSDCAQNSSLTLLDDPMVGVPRVQTPVLWRGGNADNALRLAATKARAIFYLLS